LLVSSLLVLLALAVSCGEDGDPAGPGTPGAVTTEPAAAVTGTLAAEGGSLTATAASGIAYTLEVPAGALFAPTTITMTPITSIAELGLAGGLAGAVLLEPAGLTFARAAVLRIETAETPGAGEQLAGFTAGADFAARAFSPAAAGNGEIAVLVPHFSVAGAGFGTTEDVSQFPVLGSSTLENLGNQFLAISTPWDETRRALAEQIGHEAFTQVVRPGLENAANDAELVDAVGAYDRWRTMLDVIDLDGALPIEALGGEVVHRTPAAFATEIAAAGEVAANALQAAIAANNGVCGSEASLTALANVFFWQSQAAPFGVADAAHNLDLQSVLSGICAEVRLAAVNLPAQMQVGFPHSLDADFVIHFDDGTEVTANFQVDLSGNERVTIQNPSGLTGDAGSGIGRYTTVVTATADGEIAIAARACLVLPGNTTPSPLCGSFDLTSAAGGSSGLDLSGSYMGTFGFQGSTGPDRVIHTATVTQNQNAVSGTFAASDFTGSFTATLSGTELIGADMTINGAEVVVESARTAQDGDNTSLSFDLSGTFPLAGGGTVAAGGFGLSGPDCRWENLDVSGDLNGAFVKVRHPGGDQEIFPVTGSATMTATSFTATFSGAVSGSVSGEVRRPGDGTQCSFIGVTNATILVCGQERTGGACIGTFIGRFTAVVGANIRCANGDEILEIRLPFATGGLPSFCQ
jgi:hypothetical protein